MNDRKALTLIKNTVASHQTDARVNLIRYAWFNPTWPCIWSLVLAVGVLLVVKGSLWFLMIAVPIALLFFLYCVRIKNHFSHGDANPGLVIQTEPTLIAVATDLTQGVGSYPAVKVIRTRLRTFMGEPARTGTRLPTVSVYYPGPDANVPHWADFSPLPVESGTANPEVLNRVMEAFTEEEWDRLHSAIGALPSRKPGLYTLRTWPPVYPEPPPPTFS